MHRKPAIPNKRRTNKKPVVAKKAPAPVKTAIASSAPEINREIITPGKQPSMEVKRTTPEREPAPGLIPGNLIPAPVKEKLEAPANKSEFTAEEIRTMGVIQLRGIIQDRYAGWLDLCDICKRSQLQDEFIKRLNP